MPKFKILFAEQNPKGIFLEDVLGDIIDDVELKAELCAPLTDDVSKNYVASNIKIMRLLNEARKIQLEALLFAKHNTTCKLYQAVMSEAKVTAHPMDWHDYQSFTGQVKTLEPRDGYYVTHHKGTPDQRSFWMPKASFESTHELIESEE